MKYPKSGKLPPAMALFMKKQDKLQEVRHRLAQAEFSFALERNKNTICSKQLCDYETHIETLRNQIEEKTLD